MQIDRAVSARKEGRRLLSKSEEKIVKALTTILAILCLVFTAQAVVARGGANYRSAIDRKWKEVEAWKKRQDRLFEKIEQDADRSTRGIPIQHGPVESMPYPECRTCP
jgi:hypothetical protein